MTLLVHLLDIEWLLSTLFDASLLSTSSRRKRRLLFCPRSEHLARRGAVLATMNSNYHLIRFTRSPCGDYARAWCTVSKVRRNCKIAAPVMGEA